MKLDSHSSVNVPPPEVFQEAARLPSPCGQDLGQSCSRPEQIPCHSPPEAMPRGARLGESCCSLLQGGQGGSWCQSPKKRCGGSETKCTVGGDLGSQGASSAEKSPLSTADALTSESSPPRISLSAPEEAGDGVGPEGDL